MLLFPLQPRSALHSIGEFSILAGSRIILHVSIDHPSRPQLMQLCVIFVTSDESESGCFVLAHARLCLRFVQISPTQ